ncbi:MAG: hypothetical protein ACRDK0_00990, partial [Solirubrobacteraceae bacterium]
VADGSSPTSRRLALRDEWMPRNRAGKPVAAAPYNWNDGFSPGNKIVTKVPGLDTPAALSSCRFRRGRQRPGDWNSSCVCGFE